MQKPLITSLLDTDLYKFTMMQCVFHQFKEAIVTYRFYTRKPLNLLPCAKNIQQQINFLTQLKFKQEELDYLTSLPFFKSDFIAYLKNWRFNAAHVHIALTDHFELKIEGPWLDTILFEVPLLAIISESYYAYNHPNTNYTEARKRLTGKIETLKREAPALQFTDFGTRRRFSKAWQEEMIVGFKEALPDQFVGTSNLYFAKKFNIPPIGTMAHEYLQACQVLAPSIVGSQNYALKRWLEEYPEHLGIALTDVLTMDIFLQEFDRDLSQRYQGLRQDSGDPILWGEKALAHYRSMEINPKTKTFVFSDGLNIPKAIKIYQHFKDQAKLFFGIGTNLTNDMGLDPLDIVIKMTQTNHKAVIKISDSPGKIICDDENTLQTVKTLFHL
jgi:nicotinate phosphoribosyltransferase